MGSEAIANISQPLLLPGGCILPNRLVKCPMQETLARRSENFDPPSEFTQLYGQWATAGFGLLITGQVQIDSRHLSTEADVCVRSESLSPPVLQKWKDWAKVAQSGGTPCIVQLAHPGRMAAKHYGTRQSGQRSIAPSEVKLDLGKDYLTRTVVEQTFGVPKAMDEQDIDELVTSFVLGARVAHEAGFAGIQFHAAHGFLLSQYLNPLTNTRIDAYGGSTEARLSLLRRLIVTVRNLYPAPFVLSVKLNSADFQEGGLSEDESIEYVRYLATCGLLDFIEVSGGNAESTSSPLLESICQRGEMGRAPVKMRASTMRREAYFTRFAERVKQEVGSEIPLQLSGGFRSRLAMSQALDSGVCEMIGLGRTVVICPTLPRDVLLNETISDEDASATPFKPQGLWIEKYIPKILFGSLPIQFFYMNMQRLGKGLEADNELDVLKESLVQQCHAIASHSARLLRQAIHTLCGLSIRSNQTTVFEKTSKCA